jgi:hypothetical protein
MAVLADRVKFRDMPEGKPRHAHSDGLDSAYSPAVHHVKASALAGDVDSPPLWPPRGAQQSVFQLSDPRLASAPEQSQDGLLKDEMASREMSGAGATLGAKPPARSDSDDSLVSALSRRSDDRMNVSENEQAGLALLGRTHQDSGL